MDFVRRNGLTAEVVVATDYGREMIAESGQIRVSSGRLSEEEMFWKMQENVFDLVIDATHPYAKEASSNILSAASAASLPYMRIVRREADTAEGIHVATVEEAVEFLSHTKGNILAATGSKELIKYRKLADYRTRVYPRILPDAQTVMDCMEMGFERKNLICMQGPFSRELNEAMLLQTKAKWMVTKESGREGGFEEKAQAARQAGAQLVIVGRPAREEGCSLQQAFVYLKKLYHLSSGRNITLAGIGMGSEAVMTEEVKQAIVESDLCMGAERMLACARGYSCSLQKGYQPGEVTAFLTEHPEYENICILLSGDSGFYSGAEKLREALLPMDEKLRVLPGISTLSYLCARLKLSYEDVKPLSLHGRSSNLIYHVDTQPAVFTLLNGQESVQAMCQELIEFGLSQVYISVGENLSYETERITEGLPEELVKNRYEGLCAAVIRNDHPVPGYRCGIPDEEWIRGEVPMTKAEVRAVTLSKLGLTKDSIVYDIGAGTGSVSVEAARQAWDGKVYAIEEKADAVELIRKNRRKLRAANVIPVYGKAPEVMERLEVPTHAFIGGSRGELRSIVAMLLEKNPKIRLVLNAVTLETLGEAMNCIKEMAFEDPEVVQVQIARGKKAGASHLMEGQNPVYVISCVGSGMEELLHPGEGEIKE